MDLSIIIVSYRTRDLLNKCLESLAEREQIIEFEIIVIDNNSQDGSVEMLRRNYPQVGLIENKENFGFGRACNQGIRIAQGKYILLLNPDTLVYPPTLSYIMDFMNSNPQVGIGGCYVFYPNGKPQSSFYRFPTLLSYFGRMFLIFRILPINRMTQKFFWEYKDNNVSGIVDRVLGAAMVLRKEMLNQIGTFDEAYFIYSEELDLCFRANKKGWKVSTIPGTKVIHYHLQSSIQNIREITYHSYKSDFIFFKKFFPSHKLIAIRSMQFWGVPFRLLTMAGIYLLAPSKRAFAKDKFWGYMRILFSNFDYSKSLFP